VSSGINAPVYSGMTPAGCAQTVENWSSAYHLIAPRGVSSGLFQLPGRLASHSHSLIDNSARLAGD
jgi:hypothetical protein